MQQSNFKGIVYLTKAEYESLIENGSITKSGQTLTYDKATLYVTTDTSIEEYYVGNTQWDITPTQNSTKPVISSGIYNALENKVDANNSITSDTKCKITYDSKGLVTAGADLQASDIPALAYLPDNTKYGKSLSVSGTSVSLKDQDGTVLSTITTQDTNDNQTIKGNGTTFGANSAVDIKGSGIVSVTGDNSNNEITISANLTQDLTNVTAGTLTSVNWTSLKTNHYYQVSSPVMTGLDSNCEFVNIKLSINSNNEYVKLNKNTTNKYSGMFFIEESSSIYELTVYYNGTTITLRCAEVM